MIYKLDSLVGYDKEKELYLQKILAARKHEFNIVMNHLQEYSIATISATRAYRREAYKEYRRLYNLTIKDEVTESMLNSEPDFQQYRIGMQENIIRGRQLQQKLYKANLEAITPVFGLYYGASESSYICFHKDYLYLVETICKLGTLFEQDAVCVLKPNGERGLLLKTSPKDINSDPSVKLYQPIAYFKGFDANKTRTPEKVLQECFSRVNNANFWWLPNNNAKLQSYRIVTNLMDSIPGLYPTEYRVLSIKAYAKGREYTAPDEVITTKKGVFSSWYDLSNPHELRTKLHELILKAMIHDEKEWQEYLF